MKKTLNRMIAIMLVTAMLLSMTACGQTFTPAPYPHDKYNASAVAATNTPLPSSTVVPTSPAVEPTVVPTESPKPTIDPEDLELTLGEGGINLLDYEMPFNPEGFNYVVIRIDEEQTKSVSILLESASLSNYIGDVVVEEFEITEVKLNEATLKGLDVDGSDDFVAVYRKEDGTWAETTFHNGKWRAVETKYTEYGMTRIMKIDEIVTSDVHFALPLYDSGEYEIDFDFELTYDENAFNFGFIGMENQDKVNIEMTSKSKINKIIAEIMPKDLSIEIKPDSDKTVKPTYKSDNDLVVAYVNGKESLHAVASFNSLIEETAYMYTYYENEYFEDSITSTDIILVLSNAGGLAGRPVGSAEHISENEMAWGNYEYIISPGSFSVISVVEALETKRVADDILSITYDVIFGFENSNEAFITMAKNAVEEMSESEKAYLEALDISKIGGFSMSGFAKWLTVEGGNPTGSNLLKFLKDAELSVVDVSALYEFEGRADALGLMKNGKVINIDIKSTSQAAALKKLTDYYNNLSEEDKVSVYGSDLYNEMIKSNKELLQLDVDRMVVMIDASYKQYATATPSAIIYKNASMTVANFIEDELFRSFIEDVMVKYDELTPEKQNLLKATDFKQRANDGIDDSIDTYYKIMVELSKMNDIVKAMQIITRYVNIDDFSDEKFLYGRLNDLLYGRENAPIAIDGLFKNGNFAVKDMATLYGEDQAIKNTIILEYKMFIDLIFEIEKYKESLIKILDDGIAEEFTLENDYTDIQVALATNKDNQNYEEIVAGIMEENMPNISFNVIDYIIKEEFDSKEDGIDMISDCFDVDNALDWYIENYNKINN